MKIKKGMTRAYEEERYAQQTTQDPIALDYSNYIFDKAEEWAEEMEYIIYGNGTITMPEITNTFNKIDTGMSNYQYDIIIHLLCKYWAYSDYIKYYNTHGKED